MSSPALSCGTALWRKPVLTFSPKTGHSTGYNFLKFAVLGEEDGDAEGQIYRGADFICHPAGGIRVFRRINCEWRSMLRRRQLRRHDRASLV
jgi:hypothetical protein